MSCFHGTNCPACVQTYPSFQEAVDESYGMFSFGQVDTNKAGRLSNRFQIYSIPTFFVFHSKGETQYNSHRYSRAFLNAASKYLIDQTKSINESWFPQKGRKKAILFSSKLKSPPLWSAISNNFSLTEVEIGFTSNPTLKKSFNVSKSPHILFINDEERKDYLGKINYESVQKAISDYFGVFRNSPKPTPKSRAPIEPRRKFGTILKINNPIEFQEQCQKAKFCVFQVNDQISTEFKKLTKNSRMINLFLPIASRVVHLME